MGHIVELVAILTTIGLPIGLGMYMGIRSKNQQHIERMELIKQGIIPPTEQKNKKPMSGLRSGLIFIGIGLGLAVSFILKKTFHLDEETHGIVTGASILLFMGAAFLIYFFVNKKNAVETTEDK